MSKIKIDSNLSKQFFSIGEVSTLVDVDQHVLRFWESRFLQINPLRKAGNRRYYRKEDIEFLLKIKELLYEKGLSIKGVQKLLKQKSKQILDDDPQLTLSAEEYPVMSDNIVVNKSVLNRLIEDLTETHNLIKKTLNKNS